MFAFYDVTTLNRNVDILARSSYIQNKLWLQNWREVKVQKIVISNRQQSLLTFAFQKKKEELEIT